MAKWVQSESGSGATLGLARGVVKVIVKRSLMDSTYTARVYVDAKLKEDFADREEAKRKAVRVARQLLESALFDLDEMEGT